MAYNVTTFLENKQINSENIIIQSKAIYGVLNKYIRAKDNEIKNNENFGENVVNL